MSKKTGLAKEINKSKRRHPVKVVTKESDLTMYCRCCDRPFSGCVCK